MRCWSHLNYLGPHMQSSPLKPVTQWVQGHVQWNCRAFGGIWRNGRPRTPVRSFQLVGKFHQQIESADLFHCNWTKKESTTRWSRSPPPPRRWREVGSYPLRSFGQFGSQKTCKTPYSRLCHCRSTKREQTHHSLPHPPPPFSS